jgi:SAM-dependent methyltransferase
MVDNDLALRPISGWHSRPNIVLIFLCTWRHINSNSNWNVQLHIIHSSKNWLILFAWSHGTRNICKPIFSYKLPHSKCHLENKDKSNLERPKYMISEDFSTRGKLQDVGRWYATRYVEEIARGLPKGISILDAGAGEGVYKKLFSHCNYKAIDLAVGESQWNYSNLDYIGALHEMPIDNDSFDAVLCTQVLEHLEWPRESVKEMYRVLKPGGKIYMTVPMAHPEHQVPYDFFRYTSYGLKSICKHAGFQEIKVTPFGGIWVRWAYELPRALSIFPTAGIRSRRLNIVGILLLPVKILAVPIVRLLQTIFLWLDKFDTQKDDPFAWSCEARK